MSSVFIFIRANDHVSVGESVDDAARVARPVVARDGSLWNGRGGNGEHDDGVCCGSRRSTHDAPASPSPPSSSPPRDSCGGRGLARILPATSHEFGADDVSSAVGAHLLLGADRLVNDVVGQRRRQRDEFLVQF